MADVSPLAPVQDFGSIMSSFGQGQANASATNASANLTNQQAQAAAIQNQVAKARAAIVLKAINDYTPQSDDSAAAPASGATGGTGTGVQATPGTAGTPNPGGGTPDQPSDPATPDNWYDPARVDTGLRQKFFVDPTGTPQEKKAIYTASLSGDEGLMKLATAQRQNGVDSRLAQSQNSANEMYETMSNGVVNAPPGRALDALEAISPTAAAAIRKQIPDDMEEDEAARSYATHVSNEVHQYSGRKVVPNEDGTFRDEVTGQPITGAKNIGMKPDQLAQLAAKGNELVPLKQSDGSEVQVPRYKAEGSPNLQSWITKVADTQGKVPAASPSITGAPKAQFQAAAKDAAAKAPPGAPIPPQAPAVPGQAPATQNGAPGQAKAPQGPAPGGPLAIALQDKAYRSPVVNAPLQTGTSQSTIAKGDADNYVKNKTDLQTSAAENSQAASASLASFRAAKAIMDAPDGSNIAGVLPGAMAQELAKLGFNTDTGAHRIEVAKYLTNGALQNLKTVYGSKPGVFDVKVNLDQAFPNIATMNDQSVKELIGSQIRNASYIRDSAGRVPQYLAARNEPTSFNDWNEKYFTRSNAVNEPAGQEKNQVPKAATAAPSAKVLPSGAKLSTYAQTHFGGDVGKATAFLKSNGYQ